MFYFKKKVENIIIIFVLKYIRSTPSQGGTPSKPAQQPSAQKVTRIIQRVAAPTPKKQTPQTVTRVATPSHSASSPAKPRTVINMPSLTGLQASWIN